MIGRTVYFCKELKFLFFWSPFQKCYGGSKNENFDSLQKYIVWPIKWKEILQGLIIRNQNMSQYNSVESALNMALIFFYFQDFSKSARGIILFLLHMCHHTPILHKTAEKPTVMWLFTQNCFKNTVIMTHKIRVLRFLLVIYEQETQRTNFT